MKIWVKVGGILIIAILLASSMYVVYFVEPDEETPDETENETDGTDGTNEENNDEEQNEDENDDQEFAHIVFVEESTATTCKYCTNVAEELHELFDPEDPDFYYVSLVEDENTNAFDRVSSQYNRYGNPVVFIDGGYEVIFGYKEGSFKSDFKQKVLNAVNRNKPKLHIYVNAKWNENKSELTTTVNIENKESDKYNGLLKVYITEINSPRWYDYNSDPYDYAFIDYAINENVEIEADENKSFSETWGGVYDNIYPENLWIVAVVFSSESKQSYSDPPQNKHPFDAYYADAANATRVVEGSLPPSIGISSPKGQNRYILGKELHPFTGKTLLKKPVIIGKITIKANVEAEAEVEKVEFIVKGALKEVKGTVDSEPYEWTWDAFAFGKHTITATVYDKEGKTATNSVDVFAVNFGPLLNIFK